MILKLYKFFISLLPIAYMVLIWQQSSHFNPGAVGDVLTMLNSVVIWVIGALFELAHLIEFGILYFCIILAFLCYGPLNKTKEVVAVIISGSYGLIDEIHQIFVPFRSFSLVDLLKDMIGVWAIWLLVHRYYYVKQESRFGVFLKRMTRAFERKQRDIPFR